MAWASCGIPTFAALAKPKTWLAAAGQIFFTLGVGFGIIINYSSYLKRKDDVVLSSLTASSVNEFFEVCLGGLITIPAAFMFLGAAAGKATTALRSGLQDAAQCLRRDARRAGSSAFSGS